MIIGKKKDLEKKMWDEHQIKIIFKDSAEPYNNEGYLTEKAIAAKALFNRIGHPKDFLQRIVHN